MASNGVKLRKVVKMRKVATVQREVGDLRQKPLMVTMVHLSLRHAPGATPC